MTMRKSPARTKQPKTEINIEDELLSRAVLLFASNYDSTINVEGINNFPPVQSQTEVQEPQHPEFDSALAQHRLQRKQKRWVI